MKRELYEGSPADMANDRREAKKRGMSLKEWENSPMDKAEDAKMQRRMDRDHREKMAKVNRMHRDKPSPHVFAHKQPFVGKV